MTDKGKLNKQRERGQKAENLLKNELLIEAFDNAEDRIMALWRESSINDDKTREKMFFSYHALLNVRQHLDKLIRTGKQADKELKR